MIKHVKPLAIVLFVNAGVVAIVGLLCAFGSGLVATLPTQEFSGNPDDKKVGTLLYGFMAAYCLICAALQGISGWKILKFQGRNFAVVSLIVGALSSVPCCCNPMSIGLTIYGLIVLFNDDVKQGFMLATQQGWTADQIRAYFAQRQGSGGAGGGAPPPASGGGGSAPTGGGKPPSSRPPPAFGGGGGPPPPRSL